MIARLVGGDLGTAAVALIGLWAMFVAGVSVGIWLGFTWYRRTRKWADGLEINGDRISAAGGRGLGRVEGGQAARVPERRRGGYTLHRRLSRSGSWSTDTLADREQLGAR